ncbi:jg10672 [Pararge aegeria aegeria]|uniref:Jg10672 protein n=1 Tax=Pararge aegeria aegeria TaxID=348720 RepID=A0A8S4RT47_9NEOP|nr:jg10672 [Pararge aegeria aegeria]
MDMSGEGGGAGAAQQRWYDSRVNGSPAGGDVGSEANGDGFFHSPLEGGHHSRARYYHQQMHAPYSPAVGSHVKRFMYKIIGTIIDVIVGFAQQGSFVL